MRGCNYSTIKRSMWRCTHHNHVVTALHFLGPKTSVLHCELLPTALHNLEHILGSFPSRPLPPVLIPLSSCCQALFKWSLLEGSDSPLTLPLAAGRQAIWYSEVSSIPFATSLLLSMSPGQCLSIFTLYLKWDYRLVHSIDLMDFKRLDPINAVSAPGCLSYCRQDNLPCKLNPASRCRVCLMWSITQFTCLYLIL